MTNQPINTTTDETNQPANHTQDREALQWLYLNLASRAKSPRELAYREDADWLHASLV